MPTVTFNFNGASFNVSAQVGDVMYWVQTTDTGNLTLDNTYQAPNTAQIEKVGEITLEERDRFKKKKTKEQIATDKKRSKALKERSSFPFEKATKGDIKTVGGHTGSIYAEDVTPETKRYTPTKINQVKSDNRVFSNKELLNLINLLK